MTLNQARRQLLSNGWWVAVFGALAFVPIWMAVSKDTDWRVLLTVLGGLLSGALILQKQNLDELRLFHDLFKDFNARYDVIGSRLQRIAEGGRAEPEDRTFIGNYFNLCAEEYWWYRAGYIPEDVWQSWCRGMMFYLERPLFAALWEQEVSTDSHYGLSLDAIRLGAHEET